MFENLPEFAKYLVVIAAMLIFTAIFLALILKKENNKKKLYAYDQRLIEDLERTLLQAPGLRPEFQGALISELRSCDLRYTKSFNFRPVFYNVQEVELPVVPWHILCWLTLRKMTAFREIAKRLESDENLDMCSEDRVINAQTDPSLSGNLRTAMECRLNDRTREEFNEEFFVLSGFVDFIRHRGEE